MDFFPKAMGTMKSSPVYKDYRLLQEALPRPRWVAAAFFDEQRKQKHQGWVLPGLPDASASPSSGLEVSGPGRRLGSWTSNCAISMLTASSDSLPGFRMDRVTAGVWGEWR